MSTERAYTLPARSPRHSPETQHSHVEIVTTRSQRRARPRLVYAVVAVVGLFTIFLVQLLLSIALSAGAYSIASLQNHQRDYGRSAQALTERLQTLASTQNLATRAQKLGMVGTAAPVYVHLSDGKVIGAPQAASGSNTSPAGKSLIPNSLLTGTENEGTAVVGSTKTPSIAPTTATTDQSSPGGANGATLTGTPTLTGVPSPPAPTTPGALPSPVTH